MQQLFPQWQRLFFIWTLGNFFSWSHICSQNHFWKVQTPQECKEAEDLCHKIDQQCQQQAVTINIWKLTDVSVLTNRWMLSIRTISHKSVFPSWLLTKRMTAFSYMPVQNYRKNLSYGMQPSLIHKQPAIHSVFFRHKVFWDSCTSFSASTLVLRERILFTLIRLRLPTKVVIYIRHQINTQQIHFHYQKHPWTKPKWSGKRFEKRKAEPSNVYLLSLVRKCNHKLKQWQREKKPQETQNAKTKHNKKA